MDQKKCDEFELLMPDALTHRLSLDEQAALDSHLAECSECRAMWDDFQATAGLLQAAFPERKLPASGLWNQVEASIQDRASGSKLPILVSRQNAFGPLLAVAAMLLMAALIVLGAPHANLNEHTPEYALAKNRHLNVAPLSGISRKIEPATTSVLRPDGEIKIVETTVAAPISHASSRGSRESIDDSGGLALLRRTGPAAIFDSTHRAWVAIVPGERVPYGVEFRTGAGACAELAFGESRVRIDANTHVAIRREADKTRVAELTHGRVLVDLLHADAKFKISSGGGTVELTGTVVEVDTPAPNLAFAKVLEGHVKITQASHESSRPAALIAAAAGEEALMAFNAAPDVFAALPENVKARAAALSKAMFSAARLDSGLATGAAWASALDAPAQIEATSPSLIVKDVQGHDAEPLKISELSVHTSIRGPEAITQIDEIFLNTTAQTLEGTFYFPLPPGAAISRFAMYVDSKTLIEGEVVERGQARRIFDSILRQRRDPALLEWVEGNTFKARIFPIPAKGEKHIILQYTQLLPAFYETRRYVFPLVSDQTRKSPIGRLRIDADMYSGSASEPYSAAYSPSYSKQTHVEGVGTAHVKTVLELQNIMPSADFVLTFSAPRSSEIYQSAYAEQGEAPYLLLGVQPRCPEAAPSMMPRDVLFLLETSGAQSPRDTAAEAKIMEAMIAGLEPSRDRVAVATADVGLTLMSERFDAVYSGRETQLLEKLRQRVPLGALDCVSVMNEAADFFDRASGKESERQRLIVFIGSGMPALGTLDSGVVAQVGASRLASSKIRFFAAGMGHAVDTLGLSQLALKTGGFFAPLSVDAGLSESAFSLALSLQTPMIESPRVKMDGGALSELYPQTLGSLVPGQEIFLHGRIQDTAALKPLTLSGSYAGATLERQFTVVLPKDMKADPAVGRFWARARLDALLTQPQSEETRQEIVSLAKTWTLMSPYTSFLVLESNEDYKRYDIDRSKRRDVWSAKTPALEENTDSKAAIAKERRKWIDDEYKETFGDRILADRSKNPHKDYLIYPSDWKEISERSRADNRPKPETGINSEASPTVPEELKNDVKKLENPKSALNSNVDRIVDNKYGPNPRLPNVLYDNSTSANGKSNDIQVGGRLFKGYHANGAQAEHYWPDVPRWSEDLWGNTELDAINNSDPAESFYATDIQKNKEKPEPETAWFRSPMLTPELTQKSTSGQFPAGGGTGSTPPLPPDIQWKNLGKNRITFTTNQNGEGEAKELIKPNGENSQVELQIYDVRDLTEGVTDFPGPRIDSNITTDIKAPKANIDLVKKVKDRLSGEIFATEPLIEEHGGKLVVVDSLEGRQKLGKVLEEIREEINLARDVIRYADDLKKPKGSIVAEGKSTVTTPAGSASSQDSKGKPNPTVGDIEHQLAELPRIPETQWVRCDIYCRLALLIPGVDGYRMLANGIAEFKDGPNAERLAHVFLKRVQQDTDAKVLESTLDFVKNAGLRARILARCAILQTDPAKRSELFERAFDESGDEGLYLQPLATSLMDAGKNNRAIERIESGLRHGLSQPWMWQMLPNLYEKAGRAGDVIRALTQAIAISPREAQPRLDLGRAFERRGQPVEAIREYKVACEMQPEWAEAHRVLAACTKKYSQVDGAEQAREWVLLAMLDGQWRSEDGNITAEALAGLNEIIAAHRTAGRAAKADELQKKVSLAKVNDIVVVMSWDTDKTDVDLHVVEPGKQEVNYQAKTSFRGGVLDRDVTTGFGPETYTLKHAPNGHYDIKVLYYAGNVPTTVKVKFISKQGGPDEQSKDFTVKLTQNKQEIDVYQFDVK